LYNGLSDRRGGLSVREPFLKFNFMDELIIRASQVTRQLKRPFDQAAVKMDKAGNRLTDSTLTGAGLFCQPARVRLIAMPILSMV
jgi:hypothetical protein